MSQVVCDKVVYDSFVCVTKLCVTKLLCVCEKVVCEKLSVRMCDKVVCVCDKVVVCVNVGEDAGQTRGGAGGGGCRSKNKSPTQFCGEKNQLEDSEALSKNKRRFYYGDSEAKEGQL